MVKNKECYYLIGGAKLSGAERRLLATSWHHSKLGRDNIVVVAQASLYRKYASSREPGDLRRFLLLQDELFGKSSKLVLLCSFILLNIRLIAKYFFSKNIYFHVALINPIYLPLFWFFKCSYEVTSPDVARSRYLKILARLSESVRFLCVSENVKNVFQDNLGKNLISSGRLLVRRFPYVVEQAATNYEEKKNIVVYAHRYIERKNPELAFSAFSQLALKYPDWEFRMYGDGPLYDSIKKCNSENMIRNLFVLGRSDDMNEVLKSSKIFVSLIQPDNYPSQSVLEALSFGNALLLSDTGQSKVAFLDGNGVATSLDIESVYASLEMLLSMDSLADQCGRSLKIISSKYSLKKYVDEHLMLSFDSW